MGTSQFTRYLALAILFLYRYLLRHSLYWNFIYTSISCPWLLELSLILHTCLWSCGLLCHFLTVWIMLWIYLEHWNVCTFLFIYSRLEIFLVISHMELICGCDPFYKGKNKIWYLWFIILEHNSFFFFYIYIPEALFLILCTLILEICFLDFILFSCITHQWDFCIVDFSFTLNLQIS